MRVEEDRHAARLLFAEQTPHLGAAERIDAVGRLVEDEQLRSAEEGRGEAEALAHALREPADFAVRIVLEADADELAAGVVVASRQALEAGDAREEGERRRRVRQMQALRQVADARAHRRIFGIAVEDLHGARGGSDDAEERLDEGRLARAVQADEPEGDAALDGEIDAAKRGPRAATEGARIRFARARTSIAGIASDGSRRVIR